MNAGYQLISILACLGIALSASEELVTRSLYAERGLLSWTVLGVTRRRAPVPAIQRFADRAYGPRAFPAFLSTRLGAALILAAVMVAYPNSRLAPGVLSGVILLQLLLLKRRSTFGLDGADHMYTVVFLGLTVFWLMPQGSLASYAGIAYIGGQATLSYLIAGIAKVFGPTWRDGSAIGGIMTTKIYGHPIAAALFKDRPGLGRLVCWAVIGFEISFVAVLVVDPPLLWVMLAVGIAFHAANAVLMGLNSFFMAFVATYPAIAYVNDLVHHWL